MPGGPARSHGDKLVTRGDSHEPRRGCRQQRAGATPVSIADLRENITSGQAVTRYVLRGLANGTWQVLSRGTTIGYRRLDRFPPVTVAAVRLEVERIEDTGPVTIRLD